MSSERHYGRRSGTSLHFFLDGTETTTSWPPPAQYDRWSLTATVTGEVLAEGPAPLDEDAMHIAVARFVERTEHIT